MQKMLFFQFIILDKQHCHSIRRVQTLSVIYSRKETFLNPICVTIVHENFFWSSVSVLTQMNQPILSFVSDCGRTEASRVFKDTSHL